MDNADSDAAPYHSCIGISLKIQGMAMLFYKKRMAVLFCVPVKRAYFFRPAEIITVKEEAM